MAHMATHRQNVLRSCLARSRSRALSSFLLAQPALDTTYPIRFGQLAPVSQPSAVSHMLAERQRREHDPDTLD